MLVLGGEPERLAEVSGLLVDGETWGQGCDLDQDPARFPDVDGVEVVAVERPDHLTSRRQRAVTPALELVVACTPGDVVNRSSATSPRLRRARVIAPVHVPLAAVETELALAERSETQYL